MKKFLERIWKTLRSDRQAALEFALVPILFLVIWGLARLEVRLYDIGEVLIKDPKFAPTLIFFGSINFNVFLLLAVGFLVIRNVTKLILDRKHGIFGSKLRVKLVTIMGLFAFAPAVVIFYVATGFINKSLDSWLNEKLREMLETAQSASFSLYIQDQKRLETIATNVRLRAQKALADGRDVAPVIQQLTDESNIALATLYDTDIDVAWTSDPAFLRQYSGGSSEARREQVQEMLDRFSARPDLEAVSALEISDRGDWAIVWTPIHSSFSPRPAFVLGLVDKFDARILRNVESVLAGFRSLRPSVQVVRISFYVLLALMVLLAGFACLWVGFAVSRRITTPLQSLAAATSEVAQGNYDIELPSFSDDETGTLVRSFNSMAKDLKMQRDNVARVQKMLAWREVARRVAHEIKNPLTPIKLNAQRLVRRFADRFQEDEAQVFRVCTDAILEQVESLTSLINEFASFARMPQLNAEPTDLNELVRDVVRTLESAFPDVTFDLRGLNPLSNSKVDRLQMKRAFLNVIKNSVEAFSGDRKNCIIAVSSNFDALKKVNILRFADNGPGIPDHLKQRALDPYYSTKTDGTGLGLPIVQQIVGEHGGSLHLADGQTQGLIVIIEVPTVHRAEETPHHAQT